MAEYGPVPARESERRRRNAPAFPTTKIGPDSAGILPWEIDLNPEPPDPLLNDAQVDEDGAVKADPATGWHPYVSELWWRLQTDPSRAWNGGGAMAVDLIMCENLSRLLMPRVAAVIPPTEEQEGQVIREPIAMTGAEIAAVLKWASARGLYETDRLRIHKEITFYTENPDGQLPVDGEGGEVVHITKNRADIFKQKEA